MWALVVKSSNAMQDTLQFASMPGRSHNAMSCAGSRKAFASLEGYQMVGFVRREK